MQEDPGAEDPAGRLLRLLGGKWIVQAVSTAASLGLADRLAKAPRTTEELARALDCHAPSLERLLRALAGEGLLDRDADERYHLTDLGAQLRSGELRDLAVFVGSSSQWSPWAALHHTIRTGEPAFDHVHGRGLFDHLAEHPDEARLYDDAVDAFTHREIAALADTWDFSETRTVVDVGGGRGALLLGLLDRWPHLRGVLFDRPHVVERFRRRLNDTPHAERCEAVAGDFFRELPPGADAYIVRHVLHNWGDPDATRILTRCAEAMAPDGRVLAIEGIVLPGDRPDGLRLLDLEMMVLTRDGRERTKPEFRHLFKAAGLKLERTHPLAPTGRLLVGRRR